MFFYLLFFFIPFCLSASGRQPQPITYSFPPISSIPSGSSSFSSSLPVFYPFDFQSSLSHPPKLFLVYLSLFSLVPWLLVPASLSCHFPFEMHAHTILSIFPLLFSLVVFVSLLPLSSHYVLYLFGFYLLFFSGTSFH